MEEKIVCCTLIFLAGVVLELIEIAGTVLLHLFAGALARRQAQKSPQSLQLHPIASLYIPVPSPFPVLEEFITQSVKLYNLDLFHCTPDASKNIKGENVLQVESAQSPAITPNAEKQVQIGEKEEKKTRGGDTTQAVGKSKGGEGMRRGLELYKERNPDIDAILIGTRRGDPHGGKSLYILIQAISLTWTKL